MPPVRNKPPQRGRGRVDSSMEALHPAGEVSLPTGPQKTIQKQHSSLVWNGQHVTPSTLHLLLNDVDASHFHSFSPIHVNSPDFIFDPSSSLPLPPKPDDSVSEVDTSLLAAAASDPFPSSSSPTLSLTVASPISKSPHQNLYSPIHSSTTDASSSARTPQPSEEETKRPPNQYMLYRSDYLARIKSLGLKCNLLPPGNDQWVPAPENVKTYYQSMARLTKDVHYRLHPNYKFKPRSKDQMRREKAEKTRLKQEMTAAKTAVGSRRRTKVKAKSPPPTTPKSIDPEHPSPPPNTSVDVRMYDPTNRKYFRPPPFTLGSLPPLLPPSPSPSPSSPSAPSGVQHIDGEQRTPDSPYATSPTYTLYQVDESESPRFEEECRHPTPEAFEASPAKALWPALKQEVDWHQAAPTHWYGLDGPLLYQTSAPAYYNNAPTTWSDHLRVDIPISSSPYIDTIQYGPAAPSQTFAAPSIPVGSEPDHLPAYASSAQNVAPIQGVLASAMSMEGDENEDGLRASFWNGFTANPSTEHSSTPHSYPSAAIGPIDYTGHFASQCAYEAPVRDWENWDRHTQAFQEQASPSSTSGSGTTTRLATPATHHLSSWPADEDNLDTAHHNIYGYSLHDGALALVDQPVGGWTFSEAAFHSFLQEPKTHWSNPATTHLPICQNTEPVRPIYQVASVAGSAES